MYRIMKIICLLVIISLGASGALKSHCNRNEDLLQRCSMALPVLSSPEISFALTREELDKSCIELRQGIKCIDNYTNACMDKPDQLLFRKVYSSIIDVVHELCTRGKYQDEYLKHASCVKKVRPAYETCSKNYEMTLMTLSHHQPEDHYQTDQTAMSTSKEDNLRAVCCSFHEYLLCSEQTVLSTCGEEAAVFTSSFLKRMASNIIKNFCLDYRGLECGLPGKGSHISHNMLLISVASFVNIAFYAFGNLVPA